MPGTGATALVLRQLARVRRRHNGHALQRLLFGTTAAVASGAAVVMLLAMRGTRPAFATGATVVAVAVATVTLTLMRATWRGWLRRDRAAAWVDRTMRLDGRLLTLSQTGPRNDADFVALLERQACDGLPAWTPDRVVPRRTPRAALATASVALVAVAVVLATAPRLRPTSRRVLVSDRPIDWIPSTETVGDDADVLVAPGAGHATPDGTATGGSGDGEAPGMLQAWLQRTLADEPAWESGGDPLDAATAANRGPSAPRPVTDETGTVVDGSAPADPSASPGDGRTTASERADATGGGTGTAPGAGDGTDPRLFGDATAVDPTARDHFELAIAARVRTRQGGADAPHADVPAAEPDRRPTLATGTRRATPMHRMAVPPAYESLVRRLYARRAVAPEIIP